MNNSDEKSFLIQQAMILAATGDGVYGIDKNGNTMFSNPAAEHLTGFSAEDMHGKPSHALIHHSHADGTHYPNYECPIYAAFNDGKVHRINDEVFWHKDGTSFPVEYISTPIMDKGEIVGAVISFRDVTQQKEAEEALRESEERYRKIVEATHDLSFLLRVEDGAILDVNEESCKILGYTKQALLQKTAFDIHGHQFEEVTAFIAQMRENGRGKTDRLSCLAHDGEQIPVLCSASVLHLQGVEYLQVMAQDMRETLKAKKRANILQSDLSHGARLGAMGEMASGMAHELNQPLTAILNYLEACQLILETDSTAEHTNVSKYLGKAIVQAERAGKIIAGLRSFVQKGNAERRFEDLNEIVEEASLLMLSGAMAEDIKFSAELADNPPGILVDKIQIQQVVFNLVRNAVEALADVTNAQLTIKTVVRDNDTVQVSVSDNGPGVEVSMLDTLFDAFTTTKPDGMGLGLSICQSIIEDHSGTILAKRNADGGMTFSFILPTNVDTHSDA